MVVARLEVRRAVRECLVDLPEGSRVLVACSGGADSLALTAAAAFEARTARWRLGGVSVDHGLQTGSAARARTVAAQLASWKLDPVESVHVLGDGGGDGPEGNARAARYRALDAAADRHRASVVLLGHTLDDQAETVLLGLARGSGARSLSGMPETTGKYRRPLLGLRREVVRASLPEGVEVWDDPHNLDRVFARARVRHSLLPILEKELGPGVAEALARTAELLRADADALDAAATEVFAELNDEEALSIVVLENLDRAVRWRLLRQAAIAAGCPPTDVTAAHVAGMDALVVNWHGQVGIDLPGSVRAQRMGGRLTLRCVPR